MTLQEFIQKYDGKVVADGQCGNLVRAFWNEVDLTQPPSYPNSKDYWFNPVPGYDKVQNPLPGDIAIYNGHGSYVEGHSAIYVGDGVVFEQNADPDGSPAHLFKRVSPYLLGYLRKQGQEEIPMPNDGDIINAKRAATQVPNYQPEGSEFDYYKAPEHGYHDLLYDTIGGMQAEIDSRNNEINKLKAQVGDSSEANLLGQALIKLLATFGYRKG